MSAENKGLLEPFHQACEAEIRETDFLFDSVLEVLGNGAEPDGPVKKVCVTEDGETVDVPVRVQFNHTAFNVGKVQELTVMGVTPKGEAVILGTIIRTLAISHSLGGPLFHPSAFEVEFGKDEEQRKLDSMEEIFADNDAQSLLSILKQYADQTKKL